MKTISVVEEYRKNKDLKPEDVKSLANWVKLQPHLPKMSEFFDKRDPKLPQVIKDLDILVVQNLPEKTPEGYTITFIKLMDSDTSKFNYNNQIRNLTMASELLLLKEGTAEGYVVIIDMSPLQPFHITKLNPMTIKKFLLYLQEAIPFRLKGIHLFEAPSLIQKFMMFVKPFLSKELLDILQIHTKESIEDMYKYVPKRCLPEDYGGQAPSIKTLHDVMKRTIIENRDYFIENDPIQRVDEKLRPEKSINPSTLLGIQGSFKKLEID